MAFELFGFEIYWYGIFYLLGFLFGYLFFYFLGKNYKFNNPKLNLLFTKGLDDLALYIMIGVIVGGRLGYVLFYDLSYFINNFIEVFYIWMGGMSFFGGVIGVIISMLILLKKYKLNFKDLLLVFDLIVVILPLGILLGRIGNFINQELYGKVVSESFINDFNNISILLEKLNIFYVYGSIDNNLRINTNFLESFFEGFIIFIIILTVFIKKFFKKNYLPGLLSGLFLIFYGFFRFFIEFLRDEKMVDYIFSFTSSQYFSIFFIFIGFFLIFKKFN